MITNCYLPQWLHRIACGVTSSALSITIASAGLYSFDPASSLNAGSKALLCLSVPIGVFFAAIAHRVSIVEGAAGEVGYEHLNSNKS